MDWLDWVPFLGVQWVYCDQGGKLVDHESGWEKWVFCLSCGPWAVVLYRSSEVLEVEDEAE